MTVNEHGYGRQSIELLVSGKTITRIVWGGLDNQEFKFETGYIELGYRSIPVWRPLDNDGNLDNKYLRKGSWKALYQLSMPGQQHSPKTYVDTDVDGKVIALPVTVMELSHHFVQYIASIS